VAYDLTTPAGIVRWKLADAVGPGGEAGPGGFADAEIAQALTEGGDTDGAVAVLLRILLVSRSRRASLFAEPTPGAPVRDDATAIAALRDALAIYGGDSPRIPRARFGSLGSSPSDGDGPGVPVPRCGCS